MIVERENRAGQRFGRQRHETAQGFRPICSYVYGLNGPFQFIRYTLIQESSFYFVSFLLPRNNKFNSTSISENE